jgi:hypothetical protein
LYRGQKQNVRFARNGPNGGAADLGPTVFLFLDIGRAGAGRSPPRAGNKSRTIDGRKTTLPPNTKVNTHPAQPMHICIQTFLELGPLQMRLIQNRQLSPTCGTDTCQILKVIYKYINPTRMALVVITPGLHEHARARAHTLTLQERVTG